MSDDPPGLATVTDPVRVPHKRWVKISHWLITASFFTLTYTGYVILKAHPRLYWGETGNDLTSALLELPISKNYKHGGWENRVPFFADAHSPVSASRTFEIYNENGWGRSLHFLAAWCLVLPGAVYLLAGIITGHFRRHVVPRATELSPRLLRRELVDHFRFHIRAATGGPQYGLLQKWAYAVVIFLALPLAVVTGLAMSPTITAAYPFLAQVFGGSQSARTVHFFLAVALVLFLAVHVLMVIKSGFKRQMRAMTVGE
jgi:thiosulfate reductase cytochrome b subunit